MTTKKNRTWALVCGVAVLLMAASIGHAQTEFSGLPEAGVPVFDLDVAAFRAPDGDARLEIYYRITNPRLSYIRRADEYVASYEITAVLTGKGNRQAAAVSNRENYVLGAYDETRRSSGYLINVLNLKAGKGEYTLAVTLDDRLSGGTYTATRGVDLRMAGSPDWVIGGPEFYMPDITAPGDERFRKDTAGLVPNVTRSFIDSRERLAIYFEVYNSPERTATQVVVDVSQRREDRRFVDTVSIDSTRTTVPVFYFNPLPGFHTGEAQVILRALDADGRNVGDPVESQFLLEWSLHTMVQSDWTRTVDILVHIATRDELEELREAAPEKRLAAYETFWKSKDPSPETEENEWRDEYYRRIRFANQQYANPFLPGWRTDFGMVYVKYGEPDEVERYPFELGQKPHEIWYYYGQRREFMFVDVRGNGEYELQYPFDGLIR